MSAEPRSCRRWPRSRPFARSSATSIRPAPPLEPAVGLEAGGLCDSPQSRPRAGIALAGRPAQALPRRRDRLRPHPQAARSPRRHAPRGEPWRSRTAPLQPEAVGGTADHRGWRRHRRNRCAAGVSRGKRTRGDCELPRELVAHPVDGEDELRVPGVGLDLLAEPGDVDVDGARRRHGVVAPDLVQQLLACQRGAAVLDEVAQQLEFAGRQLERLAAAGRLRPCGSRRGRRRTGSRRPGAAPAGARRSCASMRASSSAISNGLVT